MRFLSPLALLGLALVTLPVVIHLLVRRRAGRLDFPSLKFLRETPSFRLRPRRIQQPLLLALRVAAILLLVTGLARPLISFNSRARRVRVILLDASLSMKAQGRAQAAKESAQSIIDNLAAGERAAIVAFSTEGDVLSRMTADRRELATALELYQPTGGGASYALALQAANALLEREPHGEALIDLISDFQQSGLSRQQLPQPATGAVPGAQVLAHPVGARVGRNAFLTDETAGAGEPGIEVQATEMTAGEGVREGARRMWRIDSSEGVGAGIEWRTENNGQISARMRALSPDEFDADDEKFVVLETPRKQGALLIVHDGDDAIVYLRAALEATASESGRNRFTLEQKSELPQTQNGLDAFSLIVLTPGRQPDAEEMRALAEYARGGGTVWLCLGRDLDTASWNEFAGSAGGSSWPFMSLARKSAGQQALSFGAMDADASSLSLVEQQVLESLQSVRLREGYALAPRDGAATIMRWNDGDAALIQSETGSGRIVLLATSPARATGELGINAAFPALVSSIARSSIAPREPLARAIGEPVNLWLSPETPVKIVDAAGKTNTAQARDLMTRPASYFREAGIYRVESNVQTRFLAFNSPAAESETELAGAEELTRLFAQQKPAASEPQASAWHESFERQGNIWRYFLLTVFLLLIAELFVSMQRKSKAEG